MDFYNVMKHKTDYFSFEEVSALLNRCHELTEFYREQNNKRQYKHWLRNFALFYTLNRTGRRISEILGRKPFTTIPGLRPCDFFPDNLVEFTILKKRHIRSKTKSGAPIAEEKLKRLRFHKEHPRILMPVDTEYYDFMKAYIKGMELPTHLPIFRVSRQRISLVLRQLSAELGISRPNKCIHPHMFRHTFAVHFLKGNNRNPMALIQLKDLLAHSSIAITTAYTQFTPEDKLESLERAFNTQNREDD